MRGALLLSVVSQHSPWIHKAILQRESGFISPGLFTWREGSHASRLTDTMGKGNFHIILLKTQRLFMLDKCFSKTKIHPMRSSGSHRSYRTKVMMLPSDPSNTTLHCQTVWSKRWTKYMLHYRITENVIKTKLRNKFFLYFWTCF